eukprot:scaffold13173_cov78-Cyclotella_meneghiniana.AAC.4
MERDVYCWIGTTREDVNNNGPNKKTTATPTPSDPDDHETSHTSKRRSGQLHALPMYVLHTI